MLGVFVKVVVAPSAADVLVAFEAIDLVDDEFFDSCLSGFVVGYSVVHSDERPDAVGVCPDVVDGLDAGAAYAGDEFDDPLFRAFEGFDGSGVLRVDFAEGHDAEGGSASAEGVVGTGDGGVDVKAFGTCGGAP